ncbi:universal stress protein [Rhodocista pekingensis]|uniref:Universal stress protein n=1 Tax=Rhodocista pekingensis TaxID=201185 RepID=A0ABW2KWR2_9PROT
MKTVLVATDLSARSDAAVRRAALLCGDTGASLNVLHVVDDDQPADLVRQEIAAARAYLERTRPLPGARVLCEAGDPFAVITRMAVETGSDLVVLGTHRRKLLRDIFTGTTAERVIRRARVPVLMAIRPPEGAYGRVAVGIDLGSSSRLAALTADRLGLLPAGALAVHAYPSVSRMPLALAVVEKAHVHATLEKEAGAAKRELTAFLALGGLDGLDLRPVVVEGAARDQLPRWAADQGIELLVAGTRSDGGLQRLIVGSTAEALLAHAPCDVLVVPEPDAPGMDGPGTDGPVAA